MQEKVNLSINLKGHEGIELETNNLLNLIQHYAKGTTPKEQSPKNNK